MKIWVTRNNCGEVEVNFQPDMRIEGDLLDELLGLKGHLRNIPVSTERDKTVNEGAASIAIIGGHESQRWIVIKP